MAYTEMRQRISLTRKSIQSDDQYVSDDMLQHFRSIASCLAQYDQNAPYEMLAEDGANGSESHQNVESGDQDCAPDAWFYELVIKEHVFSHLNASLIERCLSWKCGLAYNVCLAALELVLVHPGVSNKIFPRTCELMPGVVQIGFAIALLVSVCVIVMFVTLRTSISSSKALKAFVTHGMAEIKENKEYEWIVTEGNSSRSRGILQYLLWTFISSLVFASDLNITSSHFSPLAALIVACVILQPRMIHRVSYVVWLIVECGDLPGFHLLEMIRKEERRVKRRLAPTMRNPTACPEPRSSGSQLDESMFWLVALESFQILEAGIYGLYHDVSKPLLAVFSIVFFLMLGVVAMIPGACQGVSTSSSMNVIIMVIGSCFLFLLASTVIKLLLRMAKTTRLYSGKRTHSIWPTVASASYKLMGCRKLTDVERADIDRFISYISKSDAGAHLFDTVIDTALMLKFGAGATAFL